MTPLDFQHFFDSIAHHYEARIIPAFSPFAHDLVTWANLPSGAITLDVGAGTGIVARHSAPLVQRVVVLDFAPAMVQIARRNTIDHNNVAVVQGDNHALPFAVGVFDVVLASFGFNATHPRYSFAEVNRVLAPGGRLVFQEWAALHEFDRRIVEALEVYAVYDEDAPLDLVNMRDFLEEERAWYHFLQDTDDYQTELTRAGFEALEVSETQPVALRISMADFLRYKLAWPSRIAELAAMDDYARADCLDKMRELLRPFADGDEMLTYDPHVFRVQARKPRA